MPDQPGIPLTAEQLAALKAMNPQYANCTKAWLTTSMFNYAPITMIVTAE